MVFLPPCWVSDISPQIPARVTVGDFVLDGRCKRASVRPPLVDASTGRTCTTEEIAENVDILAAALQEDLGWSRDDENSAEAKVVGVVCLNSVFRPITIYTRNNKRFEFKWLNSNLPD